MSYHVTVTGDHLLHEHSAHISADGYARERRWGPGARQFTPGGVALLAGLVAAVCRDLDVQLDPPPGHAESEDAVRALGQPLRRAMHCWTPQAKVSGGPDRVWRVERSFVIQHGVGEQDFPPPPVAPGASPDLMLLYDSGLGFAESPLRWPALLRDRSAAPAQEIILSTDLPIGETALWQTLLDAHSERLTVVLPVSALRARYASISQLLSWDRTIEDLDRELTRGAAFVDLGRVRRLVVYFPGAGAAIYTRGQRGGLELKRFVYHPEDLEGAWYARRPGGTLGSMLILTTAMTRHVLEPDSYPAFVALARALHAIRATHEAGGGQIKGRDPQTALAAFRGGTDPAAVVRLLMPAQDTPPASLPEAQFRAAFPHRLLGGASRPARGQDGAAGTHASDLLQDVTGRGYEYVTAMATQVVLQGVGAVLTAAPKARYAALTTVDREEIERINEIRRLMMTYQASESDRKPLSVAVFGPPGSGKSFAIKQLARDLFGGSQESFEFNLSQFATRQELHEAFNQVRDATVRGRIPLVFWDEFDTGGLAWLKEFLAPMQDAEYRSGGYVHPFGKAVFIFAGGTAADFQTFDRTTAPGTVGEQFKLAKGPDFISRLRGYVNIKGPNPIGRGGSSAIAREEDVAHVIRRAIILRSVIERSCPHLIDPLSGRAHVSPGVIRAFLRVNAYLHGARSLEAMVTMSSVAGSPRFGVSELPSSDLQRLHVTPDFMTRAHEGELEESRIEYLAEATHRAWMERRTAEGWVHGPSLSAEHKTHPLLVDYERLSETDRDRNRHSARVTLAKLGASGYNVVAHATGAQAGGDVALTENELESLAALEHDIWLRDRLLSGYEFSEHRNEHLRLHPAVLPYAELLTADKEVTRAIVDNSLTALGQCGYRLVRTTIDPNRVVIGVTGHRQLDNPQAIRDGVVRALDEIVHSYGNRPMTLISGLAEGADRVAAEAALSAHDAALVAVLPAPREVYARDFGSPGSPSSLHFEALLGRAAEILETPGGGETSEDGYAEAARLMLGRCDILLAVWDGQAARGKGGTAEVVAEARAMGKPVLIVPAVVPVAG